MPDVTTAQTPASTGLEIAIIGMAGRFPGAPDIKAFWRNLCDGIEAVSPLDPDELRARGVLDSLLDAPDFVARSAAIDGSDRFDAGFFGYSPGEADILDPQQRIFLECAWHALEDAGYAGQANGENVGVYASAGMNGYLLNLYANEKLRDTVTSYEIFTANDKDFLATRAAYKLNLRGPAVTVQTACSSSLVAVHMAVQALIAGDCDMALAGGVALSRQDGYRALAGSILSPTGQCRAFDATADGTVAGNGVGLVVLKRLEDAQADGDHIEAVIRGTAINNDGGGKASFTAPDVAAQAEVIAAAQAAAQVDPDSISYVEAHGTGTNLGDPVELTALTRAFRRGSKRQGYCTIGSVKTNIGHLDTAAGIAGLIKTTLMLRHRKLVPSLHYKTPNPRIDFASSPFTVNTSLRDWTSDGLRRAGVSSFGIGGTNAHIVLEEAPALALPRSDGPQLLTLSAKSSGALAASAASLADHLSGDGTPLSCVAHTLATGREPFRFRQAIVASSAEEAISRLRASGDASEMVEGAQPVFLFPGQGSQYPGMARELYQHLPAFAAHLDHAAAHAGPDLLATIFKDSDDIHQTQTAQIALFAVEYALAQLWLHMGITPRAMLGHSLGELTAASIAGVFSFEDGLALVAARGRLMQAAAPGVMLSVIHPAQDLAPYLTDDLDIAAENGPGLTALSGSSAAIEILEAKLASAGIAHKRIRTSHAFHSASMEDAAQQFAQVMAGMSLHAPKIPIISNLTGTWLTDAQATDPQYWAKHLRHTVRFSAGAATALELEAPVFLEIGPGATLSTLLGEAGAGRVVAGLPRGRDSRETLLSAIGSAWCHGLRPAWTKVFASERKRVSLPGYPFERQRYWIEPDAMPSRTIQAGDAQVYLPQWQRTALPAPSDKSRRSWLIFDDGKIGSALAQGLERAGSDVWRVSKGSTDFSEPGYRSFALPDDSSDPTMLLDSLAERGAAPSDLVFLWSLGETDIEAQNDDLQALIAALARSPRELRLTVITCGVADVTGAETLRPDQGLLRGLLEIAGQEYPWLGCRILDLEPGEAVPVAEHASWLRDALIAETAPIAARRGGRHWRLQHSAQPLQAADAPPKRNGVYVVMGHLTRGIGQVWTDRLQKTSGIRLAVIEDQSADRCDLAERACDLHLTADCADPEALGQALDKVTAQWGRIDGIFLSTPFSDTRVTAPLPLLGSDQKRAVAQTCIAPLTALAAAIGGRKIATVMVQSSLSSVIGGLGLAAYAGAHHHADLLVSMEDRRSRTDWYVVGWDALATGQNNQRGNSVLETFALSPDQVWDATCKILAARLTGHSIVSRADIDMRRAEWLNPVPKMGDEVAVTGRKRPPLDTPFVAPRSAVETSVTQLLQELLGLEGIGVNDGFFELGGHSLLAIRAISRLREAFPVQIEMREFLMGNPSPASIAALIETKLAGDDDIAALMAEVEGMSEDELHAALAEEVSK